MESRPLVTHFPRLSICCGREHWSRVHWGRGRRLRTEAEGPGGRPLEPEPEPELEVEVELQLGNRARVVKGPSEACGAGTHSGSHLAPSHCSSRLTHPKPTAPPPPRGNPG